MMTRFGLDFRRVPPFAALAVLSLGVWSVHAQGIPLAFTSPANFGAPVDSDPAVPQPVEAVEAAISQHVIIISVDGLRPDALTKFRAPNMQRLMREGAYSLSARTIDPSRTLPSHTSMLTGVDPSVHGITWNENLTGIHGTIQTPTVFSIASASGLATAAFFSKGKFNHLMIPGTIDHAAAPTGNRIWFAGRTADRVTEHLVRERPNLLMVHFGEPDYAGHTLGWMGTAYGWAVRRADSAVGRVLTAADRAFGPGAYTVILTSDHGGHGRTHGTTAPEDVTIPWIAWGRGVSEGQKLEQRINTIDTAASALWLLGLSLPSATGVPVAQAFAAAAPGSSITAPGVE